jgi:hypothetical protein
MKISDAINILNIKNYDITNIQHISYNELKKHYHIQSLIYHPDKNTNNHNATLLFQNINCAFVTLRDFIKNNDLNTNEPLNEDDSYNNLVINFINYIVNYYGNTNVLNSNSLDDLKIEANKQLYKFLETLFSNFSLIILEDIYLVLLKFNNNNINTPITHTNYLLTNNIVNIIKKISIGILEKNDIYIISPTISNLLNSDIYRLTIANDIVYVPLWHRELAFENAIIKIYPILDNNITIDSNNNIHYTYNNKFSTLLENITNNVDTISVVINNSNFTINISMLKMCKYQTYIIENEGIPNININNILDNSIKGTITFHIHLE